MVNNFENGLFIPVHGGATVGTGVVTVGHGAALHDEGARVAVHVGRVDALV